MTVKEPWIVLPHRAWHATLEGTLNNNADIWNVNFWIADPNADSPAPYGSTLTAIGNAWAHLMNQDAGTYMSHTTHFTTVKLARINVDGTTDKDTTLVGSAWDSYGAGGVSVYPQLTVCASTISSDIPRGPGHRGRMFLPSICWPADDNGHIQAGKNTGLATAVKTFLDSVNTQLKADFAGGNTRVAHVPLGTARNPGPHASAYITTVAVGDVMDTQRRRRNKLRETYANANLAA